MQIAPRCVAYFRYRLTDESGHELDASADGEPLAYLHGGGNIVPGLERAMEGREPGDSFEVDIAAEDGYGPHIPNLVQQVPRGQFPEMELAPGMRFSAESSRGPLTVVITAVAGDTVTVDGNHPLAGQRLHFTVEVTDVREATTEEVLHGHVHDGEHAH
ncbi:MAG: peptidylprolyl isomerase [Gammaproteobacteria bacterium]|nr:peptidylprolyl isomerase [Gammaproteobacteria bacterium]